jgi:hypothetical protein
MSIATREPDLVGIDPNRSALLHRMLAKDPARRPTARQVLDRLRGNTTGGTTLTDTPEPTIAVGAMAAAASPAAPPTLSAPPPPAAAAARNAAPAPALPGSSNLPGAVSPTVVRSAGAPASEPTLVAPLVGTAPAPPPARPRTAGNPRVVGPRTAAAQQRRSTRRRVLVGLLVVLVLIVGGWFVVQAFGGDSPPSDGSGSGGSTGTPPSAADAPPAPASDQLKDGDWLLEKYNYVNTADGLVLSGTVRNTGSSTGSADLTTWVYRGEESLGSVSTTVTDVPAGETVRVTMTGDAVWKKGKKVVLLQAS